MVTMSGLFGRVKILVSCLMCELAKKGKRSICEETGSMGTTNQSAVLAWVGNFGGVVAAVHDEAEAQSAVTALRVEIEQAGSRSVICLPVAEAENSLAG